MTLSEFLTARLDEDEAAANDVHEVGCFAGEIDDRTGTMWPCDCHYPARVLREVEAKRKILGIHYPLPSTYGEPPTCAACWPEPKIGTHPLWPCSTVRALLAVYSDHPDYDPAWR